MSPSYLQYINKAQGPSPSERQEHTNTHPPSHQFQAPPSRNVSFSFNPSTQPLHKMFTIAALSRKLKNAAAKLETAAAPFLNCFRRRDTKAHARNQEFESSSTDSDSVKSRLFAKRPTANSDSSKESDTRTVRNGASCGGHSSDTTSSGRVKRLVQHFELLNQCSGGNRRENWRGNWRGNWRSTDSVLASDGSPSPTPMITHFREGDRLVVIVPEHSPETDRPRPAPRRSPSEICTERLCRIAEANGRGKVSSSVKARMRRIVGTSSGRQSSETLPLPCGESLDLLCGEILD